MVCDRGATTLVSKVEAVAAAGGDGVVIRNVSGGATNLPSITYVIPGTLINAADGAELLTWMSSGSGHTASISASTAAHIAGTGDIKASFSFRGPGDNDFEVLKPDLTAPGLSIVAAYEDGMIAADSSAEYELLQGTSMSSPHVAGAAALLTALHPTWTPAMLKSALMLSAKPSGQLMKENGVTAADPFDFGAGRVNLNAAARTGLVMDESAADFTAADPSQGGDPTALNIPSLQNNQCISACSWTRTFTNVAGVSATYTVTPNQGWLTASTSGFTLDGGASVDVTFTADATQLNLNEWGFAAVGISSTGTFPTGEAISPVTLPVAVQAANSSLPAAITIDSFSNSGQIVLEDLMAIKITELISQSYGLVKADLTDIILAVDPSNSLPFDDLDQVFSTTLVVPEDGSIARMVFEITDTTASDLDLYIGYDSDGNGKPSTDELYVIRATASALEYFSELGPYPGTYWFLVQNWAGSTEGDAVTFASALVPYADAGNMTISGPSTVHANTPFDVTLNYSKTTQPGDRLYGAFNLSTPSNLTASAPSDLGTTTVDIRRLGDWLTYMPIIGKH